MGRNNTEEGESSAKTYKSDSSNGRPLRKARYLWQIKGKYHMKKPENEASQGFFSDENNDTKSSATEMLENCASKCLKESCSTMQEENNNKAFSQETKSSTLSESKVNEEIKIADRIKRRQMHICDLRLRKWQAHQVAWCYFDNTINRVMEQSGFLPSLRDKEALLQNFNRRRAQRRGLENRAVMMAIHSHGLQRTVVELPSASGDCISSEEVNSDHNLSEVTLSCSQCQNGITKVNVEADINTNSGSESLTEDEEDVYLTKEQDSSSVSDSDISYKSVDSENVTFQSVPISLLHKVANVEDESTSLMEHTDFMDKAVAVAIQKKGLSTFNNMEHK